MHFEVTYNHIDLVQSDNNCLYAFCVYSILHFVVSILFYSFLSLLYECALYVLQVIPFARVISDDGSLLKRV